MSEFEELWLFPQDHQHIDPNRVNVDWTISSICSLVKSCPRPIPGHSLETFCHSASERKFSTQKGNDLHWLGRNG